MLCLLFIWVAFDDGQLFLALSGGQGVAASQGKQLEAKMNATPRQYEKKLRQKVIWAGFLGNRRQQKGLRLIA